MKIFNLSSARILLAAALTWPAAKPAQVLFEKDYPSAYDRTTRDVVQTPDGGYLLAGMTNNANIFDCDLYILKTDAMGNFVKETIYGGSKPDYAYSMVPTHDGNYIIAGYSQSYGGGDYDMFVAKVNANGDVLSSKDIGGPGNEEAREIIRSSDNNYYLVGTTGLTGSNAQILLVKIDVNLTELASWTYGGAGMEYGLGLKQTSDGGFIISGQTSSKGNGQGDAYLLKIKPDMSIDWDATYGGAYNDEAVGVVANDDGSYVFAMRDSSTTPDIDVKVFKVDASGNKIWEKHFGGPEKDTPKTIAALGNGEYIVGAISRSFNDAKMPDMWLLKIKDYGTYGDTTWARFYGRSNHDHCHNARPVSDGLVAVGHSRNPTQKVYFLKLSFDGRLVLSDNQLSAETLNTEVFPNPCRDGLLRMRCEQPGLYDLKLFNLLGEAVVQKQIDFGASAESTLDLHGLSNGIYVVQVTGAGKSFTQKIAIE